MLLVCAVFASGAVHAQDDEERDSQKTKQAQAVSKEVYDRIQKAQELIDADNPKEALQMLESLKGKKGLTEYELQNVLNYIGFVHYNLENIPQAIATYREMLRIPSIEEQIKKQTTYTLSQLLTMEENYDEAIKTLETWFTLESNPPPDAYILYAQNLYQVNRYPEMVKPIESAMQVARDRELEVREDWYVLLNFAYFQQENYVMVRDIHKLVFWYWRIMG
jgi:tetratricopeptide (TPR) repeat protein